MQDRHSDGRYTFDHDTVCACGHRFGNHAGAGKARPCFVDDCDCEKFVKARKRATMRDRVLATGKVLDAFQDSDGCWATLKPGYVSLRTDCNREHEDTWTELLRAVREAASV